MTDPSPVSGHLSSTTLDLLIDPGKPLTEPVTFCNHVIELSIDERESSSHQ